jgi:hypothetical protein
MIFSERRVQPCSLTPALTLVVVVRVQLYNGGGAIMHHTTSSRLPRICMVGILTNRAVSMVEHVAYVSLQLGCIVFRLIAERKCVGGWVRLSTGCVW